MNNKQLQKRYYLIGILIIVFMIVLPMFKNIINSYSAKLRTQKAQTSENSFDEEDFGVPYGEREVPDYKNLKIVKVVCGLALDSNGHVWEKYENSQGLFPVWKKDGSLLSDIIDIESAGITFYALSKDHTGWAWGSDMFGLVPVARGFRNIYSEYRDIEYPEKIVFKDGSIVQGIKKISACTDVCYLIMEDDTVYASGSNEDEFQFLGLPGNWTADASEFEGLGNLKKMLTSYYSNPNTPVDVLPYPQKMQDVSGVKDIFCCKTSNASSIHFLLNDGTTFIKGIDEKYCDFKKFLPAKVLMTSNCDVSVALLSDKTALSWYCIPEDFSKEEKEAYLFLGHKKDGNVNYPARIRNNKTGEIIQNIDAVSGYDIGFMILKNGQVWRQGSGPQDNGTDWISIMDLQSIEPDFEFDSIEDFTLDKILEAASSGKMNEKPKENKSLAVTPYLFHQKYADGSPVDDAKEIFSDGSTFYLINNDGILYAWGGAKWLIEGAEDNEKDCYFPRKVTFHPYYDKEKSAWISITQE